MPALDRLDAHPGALFYQLLHERSYSFTTVRGVSTKADPMALLRSLDFQQQREFFESDGDTMSAWTSPVHDVLIYMRKEFQHIIFLFAGRDKAELETLIEKIFGELPEVKPHK